MRADIGISEARYRELLAAEERIKLLEYHRRQEIATNETLLSMGAGNIIFRTRDGVMQSQRVPEKYLRMPRVERPLGSCAAPAEATAECIPTASLFRTYVRTSEHICGVRVYDEIHESIR